jgi:hypothetical protein
MCRQQFFRARPNRQTRPRSVIYPVIATSRRTFCCVSAEIIGLPA